MSRYSVTEVSTHFDVQLFFLLLHLIRLTTYITFGGQQEGKLEQSENSQQTLCLLLHYLDLTRTDGQIASPEI